MREILFRGKRKDNGEWIYGYLSKETVCTIYDTYLSFVIHIEPQGVYHSERYEVIPETVGQYTGGEDKTGNKIFEDDIVKILEDGDIGIGVIQYDLSDCAFIICARGCDFSMDYAKDSEIIGNVCDNPELLEVKI